MKKRIMSLMLTLCMACALLPAAVAPAAAISGKDLDAAKEVIEKNITEIALSNETTEEYLARTLTAMLPEGNQTRILIEFASRTPATTEKTGLITCKWFLYDGTKVGMDYLSSGMTVLTIPVAKQSADEVAKIEADVTAIGAAFAKYFETANVTSNNILQQKNNLLNAAKDALKNGSQIRWSNDPMFSTASPKDGKDGYIRGTLTVILGAETRSVKLNAEIHANGSVTMKSPTVATTTPTKTYTATPTNDKLSVDGQAKTPTAYKIEGANYFQLRDVALLLNGTPAQFSVEYDGSRKAVIITTGQPYTPNGTEGKAAAGNAQAIVGNDNVFVDGVKVDFTVYKINGSNYFQIRDLGRRLGFNVDWTRERGMFIESDKPYSGN